MGKRKRNLSLQALRILHYLFQNPGKPSCGADLIKSLNISSGTMYPILLRLEKNNFVESKWEVEDASALGRPRRRLYKITGSGIKAAQNALAEFNAVSPKSGLGHRSAAQ